MYFSDIEIDVLIIGSGASGIRAAIEASDNNVKVILLSTKKHGYSGSTFYPLSMP